jgi:hypothetical protein
MPARYFFGKSVKSSYVTPSTARSFEELVKKHLETDYPLAITRDAYHALESRKDRLNAKDSPYLTACTFKDEFITDDGVTRVAEHATGLCNLIFLDIDDPQDAAPLVSRPETMRRALGAWNFAAYTTASSTRQSPRLRVVVDAESLTFAGHARAVRHVAHLLGIETVTKESLVPNQPMILPSRFSDQDPNLEHPLVMSHLKGRQYTMGDVPDKDPGEDKARELVKDRGVNVAEGFHGGAGEDDGLEFLRMPLEGVNLKMVTEMLRHVDPNCSYHQWLDVACALKHQFGHTHEAFDAYSAFDSWSGSASKDKYAGPEDTLRQWNAIKPSPKGKAPVTIRTVIKRASDAGWNAGEVKEACFATVQKWIEEEANTRHDLSSTALEKIAALPLLTAVEENMLVSLVRGKLKNSFGESVSSVALQKDLKRARDKRERAKDSADEPNTPAWAMGWAYITADEKFFKPTSHIKLTANALDSAYSRYLLPTAEQLIAAGRDVTQADLSRPLVMPSAYLLNDVKCLVCDEYDYDPANPKSVYTEDAEGRRLVNTYRRSYAKADSSMAAKAGALLKEHFSNLILEPEYQRVLFDFIAYLVQFPGRKIRWTIVIQGGEGSGKTFIAKLMAAVLGDGNVSVVSNDAIRSQWNDWAFGAQLVVVGEVRVHGHNRHDVMNKLKEAITDDRISITQRNRDARTVRNQTNFIMFTNFHDALALTESSRRYFVVKSPLQTPEQVNALGDDYFDRLFGALTQFPGGFRAFFESWEISDDFEPDGRAPVTKYLKEMIEDSADSVSGTIRQLIADGANPLIAEDLIAEGSLMAALEVEGVRESAQYLTRVLRDNQYVRVAGRPMLGGVRQFLWGRAGAFDGVEPEELHEIARKRLEGEGDEFV